MSGVGRSAYELRKRNDVRIEGLWVPDPTVL